MSREDIKAAVKEALADEIKPLYIDRETHYEDHRFIKDLRAFMAETKGTIRGVIVRALVLAGLGLLFLGFIAWGKEYFK